MHAVGRSFSAVGGQCACIVSATTIPEFNDYCMVPDLGHTLVFIYLVFFFFFFFLNDKLFMGTEQYELLYSLPYTKNQRKKNNTNFKIQTNKQTKKKTLTYRTKN